MEKAENSMLALVVNWARTPPLAREDDPWPTEASRSRTSTRSTPARRSSRATDSPMTPPPTTATSTVSGTTPGPSGDRGQPRLGPGGQVLGQPDQADPEQQVDDLDHPVGRATEQVPLGQADDRHDQAQTAAAATRPAGTPARWARAAIVQSPSTSRMPRSWCRSTRPRALPVQKSTPRTSWTTQTTRMPIWRPVMVRMLLLSLGRTVRRASRDGPGRTRRRRRPAGPGRGPRA